MALVNFDRGGGRMSDGELAHGSTHVWGIAIFGSRKAHYWERHTDRYVSTCGSSVIPLTIPNGQNSLLGPGNYPKCKRCMEFLRRHSARSAGVEVFTEAPSTLKRKPHDPL